MLNFKEDGHFDWIREGLLNDCEDQNEIITLSRTVTNRSIHITWPELKTYILANNRSGTVSDKQVVSSSNIPVPIKANVVDRYRAAGLDILAYNECDELRNDPNLTEMANEVMMEFLKGKPPGWEVFFYNDESKIPYTSPVIKGLIERDLVDKLVKSLKSTAERTDKCMKIFPINHLPGTGATTIAKHVLWKLRKEFRCVVMDGRSPAGVDFRDVAEKLLGLRGLQENDATIMGTSKKICKPILLLIDNSSYDDARQIQNKFQDLITDKRIMFEKTVGIILCVQPGTARW